MKNKEISYGSMRELESMLGRIGPGPIPTQYSDVIEDPLYLSKWAQRIDEVDPGGRKANELAKKYSHKNYTKK